MPTHYGTALARIHHQSFGEVARSAARELIARLGRQGISSGTVVDLAAGSGILSRCMSEAGFKTWGVDLSEDMLCIARAEAPGSTFVHGSLWSVDLPPCVAVAAVGEAFSYAADPAAGQSALGGRLAAVHRILSPGGVLLFDIAGPGRSGPDGERRAFWAREGVRLGMEERENSSLRELSRAITLFVPEGNLYRRLEEIHVLRLYPPDEVESLLTRSGFTWERLRGYDQFFFSSGWHAYAAIKA